LLVAVEHLVAVAPEPLVVRVQVVFVAQSLQRAAAVLYLQPLVTL
jgi:hypothetical protein